MNLVNQMLHSGVYDHMSVSEFARAVKTAKELEEFDVDKWAEETMAIYLEEERRQALIEEREHYADYSDQE